MPASARAADRRGVWAWVLAGSASGGRFNFVGTVGTNRKNPRKPLSPLEKSVPTGTGDKPFFRGDSGDNSIRERPRACTPCPCLVPGAPEPWFCSANAAPCRRPYRRHGHGSRRVTGQGRTGRAGCGSSGTSPGRASGACSRTGGPCRGSGNHAPTARGKPPPGRSLGTPRP